MTPARTLMAVQNDASVLAQRGFTAPLDRALAGEKARALAAEAFDLGRAAALQENRKALGRAWSAFLGQMSDDFWKTLPYDDPDLYLRLRQAILMDRP